MITVNSGVSAATQVKYERFLQIAKSRSERVYKLRCLSTSAYTADELRKEYALAADRIEQAGFAKIEMPEGLEADISKMFW